MGYVYERVVEHSYRLYVTKQLVASAQGKYIDYEWGKLVTTDERHGEKNGDAIAKDVVSRAGLVVRR